MIIGSNLLFYEKLSSTNSQASLLLKDKDLPEGTVVYTDFQTGGRGQGANRWESEKCKNLLLSIILYPDSVQPEEQFAISIAISLGICDFIDRYYSGCKIKWPNDIYINNGKIAGILIENSIFGPEIKSSVAGIGLNINQENFPDNISNPISLKQVAGKEFDRDVILEQLLSDLDIRYKQLLYGDRSHLKDEYISRLYRLNEWCAFKSGNKEFTGRITDISDHGNLRIEGQNGRIAEFSFREVDYVL
jgi:BirA family biotin operon repressor/biotin-[acetyl-CoA-carboxylase] ligase